MRVRFHSHPSIELVDPTISLTAQLVDDNGAGVGIGHTVSIPCRRVAQSADMDPELLAWSLRALASGIERMVVQ